MPLPRRRPEPPADQPGLPLDLGAAAPPLPRAPRARSRSRVEAPVQLALDFRIEEAPSGARCPAEPGFAALAAKPQDNGPIPPAGEDEGADGEPLPAAPLPLADQPSPKILAEPPAEALTLDPEPPDFDLDPFADIPGFVPAAAVAGEFVLLPGSLRSRLDMRELTRFLASLQSVARDWEGAPEMDDGGIRLQGPEGGAWIYPEPNRVRVATDGAIPRPVAEELVALCRWLESRAGMQLYPAGEATGTGADRSLDPWDTFLGR